MRFWSAWIAGVLLACAVPARAQSLGQFTGAQTLPINGRSFGAYVHAGGHVVGFVSQLRLSFYPGVDFGFQGGLDRLDWSGADRTLLRLGADFKVACMKASAQFPVDLSFGGALGVDTGDDMSVFTLGPTAIASRTFPTGKEGTVTPYAALGIGYSSIDVPGTDDTGLQLPLRIGAEFAIAPEFHLVIELQERLGTSYSDRGTLLLGANLPF
jgi:hypothetical protein